MALSGNVWDKSFAREQLEAAKAEAMERGTRSGNLLPSSHCQGLQGCFSAATLPKLSICHSCILISLSSGSLCSIPAQLSCSEASILSTENCPAAWISSLKPAYPSQWLCLITRTPNKHGACTESA